MDTWYPIPELVVAFVALVAFVVCIWSAAKGDLSAIGWAVWALITCTLYLWIYYYNPDDEFRRGFVRIDIIMALVNVFYWRLDNIIKKSRRS